MKYTKPEIKIEKFSIVDEIMSDQTSAISGFDPVIEGNDPNFETIGQSFIDELII